MKNPLPYMAKYPQADCLTSSDHIVRWPPPLPPFHACPRRPDANACLQVPTSTPAPGTLMGSTTGLSGGSRVVAQQECDGMGRGRR